MFTGWLKPFDIRQTLARMALTSVDARRARPDEQFSLVRLNDRYAEFIDRAFRMRGSVVTLFGLICAAILVGVFVMVCLMAWQVHEAGRDGFGATFVAPLFPLSVAVVGLVVIWRRGFGHELFAHVYCPIRFDRETQQVHVFRHEGEGGMLSVPFDQVYWHIGCGEQMDFLYDLRGAVLDDGRITHMFAVGQYFEADGEQRVRSLWSFICTYMQGGPEALAARGVTPRIDLSVQPSWRNCWRWKMLMLGETAARLRYVLAPLYYPVLAILTAWRWLVFRTCRMPRWPAELFGATTEAERRSAWPEPALIGGDGSTSSRPL